MNRILITGANRGIGLELCRQLNDRGDDVTAVCRSVSEGLNQLGLEVIDGVNVSDGDSVADLSKAVAGRQFDW